MLKDDFATLFDKMVETDGIILASPVYFSSATPQIKALIDRAGQNFTFAELAFFFFHQGMIIPGSTYWNIAFGREKGEAEKDEEGVTTIRNFAKKLAWLVKVLEGSKKAS